MFRSLCHWSPAAPSLCAHGALCLALSAAALACESSSGTDETDEATEGQDQVPTHTWYGDVQPLMLDACGGCHSPNNIAPFPLTNYGEVFAVSTILPAAIETGEMPPWHPSQGCNDYAHDRSLSPEDREMLLTWLAEGAPEGDPSEAAPLPEPEPEWVPDVVAEMPAAYTPEMEPDDYRCFLIDGPELEDTAYLTSFEVFPGERSVVHHTIAFVIRPEALELFEALEASEPEPGYTCFGGPTGMEGGGLSGARWLGAWAPGVSRWETPSGTGVAIEPGSKIVMQMHYNTSSSAPLPDRSSIGLELSDSVEREAMTMPVTNLGWVLGSQPMLIPAGEPSVVHSVSVPRSSAPYAQMLETIGVGPDDLAYVSSSGPHMHLLGRRAQVSLRHQDGSESCLVQIDDYDFAWQDSYVIDEPVVWGPEDSLELSCEWDNSAKNQPVINGEIRDPEDVTWGEGTFDEMCLTTVFVNG